MPELFRQLFEIVQTILTGMLDFIGAFGRGSDGRLVTALVLAIVGGIMASRWKSNTGKLVRSLVFGSATFALIRGLGGSADLGTLAAAIIIGFAAWKMTSTAFKSRSWAWTAGGVLITTAMILAVLSLANSAFLEGQLPRDTRRIVATVKNVVTNLVDAANDGADQMGGDRREGNRQR